VTIGRRLFISSAAFALLIACGYWVVAREITGTFLLGFLAFALSFIAGYMVVAEKKADLWGDRDDASMAEAADQVIGTYSIRSPLPFWSALAITSITLGLVISPTLAVLGLLAALVLGTFFIIQSR
jgi:4-hydroxybenzoate polyprenyltransferase